MQLKFYACPHCGNQLLFLNRTQPPAPCCCRAMEELHPNTCGSPDEMCIRDRPRTSSGG